MRKVRRIGMIRMVRILSTDTKVNTLDEEHCHRYKEEEEE